MIRAASGFREGRRNKGLVLTSCSAAILGSTDQCWKCRKCEHGKATGPLKGKSVKARDKQPLKLSDFSSESTVWGDGSNMLSLLLLTYSVSTYKGPRYLQVEHTRLLVLQVCFPQLDPVTSFTQEKQLDSVTPCS